MCYCKYVFKLYILYSIFYLLSTVYKYGKKLMQNISFSTDPKLRHGRRSHEIQYFRFSDKIMRSKVVRAQLWLYVRGAADQEFETTPTSADEVRAINVSVLRVLRVNGQPVPPESPTLEILHTSKEEQPRGRGGWITVEVKKLLTEWFKFPRDNLGIIVQATDELGNQLAVTDPDAEDGSLVT